MNIRLRRKFSPAFVFCGAASGLCLALAIISNHWPSLSSTHIVRHQGSFRMAGYLFLMLELWIGSRLETRPPADKMPTSEVIDESNWPL